MKYQQYTRYQFALISIPTFILSLCVTQIAKATDTNDANGQYLLEQSFADPYSENYPEGYPEGYPESLGEPYPESYAEPYSEPYAESYPDPYAYAPQQNSCSAEQPSEPHGHFAMKIKIATDQMCHLGDTFICNAFIIGFSQEGTTMQAVPNILGTQLTCPKYSFKGTLLNPQSESCDLQKSYVAEIHCADLTTGQTWVAPTGSFEVGCVTDGQFTQMRDDFTEYLARNFEKIMRKIKGVVKTNA